MSMILKGIDLPEKNESLYIKIFNGKAEVVHPLDACELVHINGEAIQIPKDHGKIKDINTFLKDKCLTEYIENDVFNKKYTYTISTVAIYNAPTILESEGNYEHNIGRN